MWNINFCINSFGSCTTDFTFSLQQAPFPSRLVKRDQALILQSQRLLSTFTTVDKLVIVCYFTYGNGTFFLTPRYYGLSLIWTLNEVLSVSAITRVDWNVTFVKGAPIYYTGGCWQDFLYVYFTFLLTGSPFFSRSFLYWNCFGNSFVQPPPHPKKITNKWSVTNFSNF